MAAADGSIAIEIDGANDRSISLPALVDVAEEANDSPYQLSTVIAEKCYGAGAWGAPKRFCAFVDGELAGVAVLSSSYLRLLAVRRQYRGRGAGQLLLARCEREARAAGAARLVVAGEPGNYFVPGVVEDDVRTLGFFERHGYVRGDLAQNMEADLDLIDDDPAEREVAVERASRTVAGEVTTYVTAEFGRLWAFEISPAFDEPQPPLFIARAEGEIVGFSAHEVNNRGLGFYGPAGVTKSWRGGGIGALLLRASLRDLQRRGYTRAIIPWVSSVTFYGRIARAVPSHRFIGLQKEL